MLTSDLLTSSGWKQPDYTLRLSDSDAKTRLGEKSGDKREGEQTIALSVSKPNIRIKLVNTEKSKNSKNKELTFSDMDVDYKVRPDHREIAISSIQDSKPDLIFSPNPNVADRIYISGATGSGKTTLIVKYLNLLLKICPNKRILVFSDVALESDNLLGGIKHTRVKLDMSIVENPITMQELAGSLVICDDIDSITNPKVKNAVFSMIDSICKQGSSKEKITLIITNHEFSDYQRTRSILTNCNFIVWFSGATKLDYSLSKIGMSKDEIRIVRALDSRYICLHKNAPRYIVHEKGCYLL
jgi:DNA replication protein DnaC